MTPEQLLDGYRRMALIREFEERLYALFREGVLYGTTHAYTGQEAIAVGVIGRLDRERDVITSNHRGHGHYLAYSDDVDGLLAELMGRASGACRGWGGSQHLRYGNFLSNGVLGSMIPVGVGMALAEKRKQSGAIVCNFLGDGTLGEGVVYEALNMAGLWKLPVLFCVENNRYQQAVAAERAVAGDMAARGAAFGLETAVLDGNDLEEIDARLGKIVELVRNEHVPHWVVFDTYRMAGHSKSDDSCYRSREEEARWRERDPLKAVEPKLPAGARAAIEKDVRARVDAALERARAAAQPRLEDAPER
jgi:acetoin:2,6-dichlorophenolindophenol oxidoreductase subunit alpha